MVFKRVGEVSCFGFRVRVLAGVSRVCFLDVATSRFIAICSAASMKALGTIIYLEAAPTGASMLSASLVLIM